MTATTTMIMIAARIDTKITHEGTGVTSPIMMTLAAGITRTWA